MTEAPRRPLVPPLLRRILLLLALTPVGCYFAIAALVYLAQDSLLFYGNATRISETQAAEIAKRTGGEELHITTGTDAILHGIFVPGAGEGPRPTLLYFGGNAETVARRAGENERLRQLGWNLALVAYRGFGLSSGKPSGAVILDDALLVYDVIAARPDVDAARIATWGRSLGTGVAAHVAANRKVIGVVLLSPYARLSDTASHHYPWLPVRLLFRHEIDSLAKAPTINTPALLIHGTKDRVIPHSQSVQLQEAWQPRPELVSLKGRGHNDVDSDPVYPKVGIEFLESLLN